MKTQTLRSAHVIALACASLALIGCGGNKKKSPASTAAAVTSSATTSQTTSSSSGANTSGSSAALGSSALGALPAPAAGAPTLVGVSPSSGPLDGGTPLTLSGTNFTASGAGQTLVLVGTQAVLVTPTSDTEIQLNAPRGTTVQAEDVRVVNDLGTALLPQAFAYDARPAGLAFLPVVGHHELGIGGTRITISLSEFPPLTSAAVVRFGTTDATTVSFVDSKTLTAEVPQGVTPGLTEISVEDTGLVVSQPGFKVQGALVYGDLIVNEFCAHPGGMDFNKDAYGDSKADEFIEIVNTTQEWVDLSYLTIWDGANRERHRFLNPTVLPPGGGIVVFGGGTPDGFKARGESGHAQAAVADELALNNSGDTIEIRTLPGLNPSGDVIFRVDYSNPPSGSSFVNLNDGQRITANPATSADYEDHNGAPGTTSEASPGFKKDGSPF